MGGIPDHKCVIENSIAIPYYQLREVGVAKIGNTRHKYLLVHELNIFAIWKKKRKNTTEEKGEPELQKEIDVMDQRNR